MDPGGGVTQSWSVLQACIDLFKRCSDPSSAWGMSGPARRSIPVPPTARSYSGGGGVPPQLPMRLPLQHQQPFVVSTIGTSSKVTEATASWGEESNNKNGASTSRLPWLQQQQHRNSNRDSNTPMSSPAGGSAAAEGPPATTAALVPWDMKEPWEHWVAAATTAPPTPPPPPPPAHPLVLQQGHLEKNGAFGSALLRMSTDEAAAAAAARAKSGELFAGWADSNNSSHDDDFDFEHTFGRPSAGTTTTAAAAPSSGAKIWMREVPTSVGENGRFGSRAGAAVVTTVAASAAGAARAAAGAGAVCASSSGGPGASPVLVPGGDGGRTDADANAGSPSLGYECAGADISTTTAAAAATAAAAGEGGLQDFNGWTDLLDAVGNGSDGGERVAATRAAAAAPGIGAAGKSSTRSMLGVGGGNGVLMRQAAAASGAGEARESEDPETRRTALRARIDDVLGAARREAAARRGAAAGDSSTAPEGNGSMVSGRHVAGGNGFLEAAVAAARPKATSGSGGGGLDFGPAAAAADGGGGISAASEHLPPVEDRFTMERLMCSSSSPSSSTAAFLVQGKKPKIPNAGDAKRFGASDGGGEGLLATKVEVYARALAKLVFGGDGDNGAVAGTGGVGEAGSMEDLRVLRACLLDSTISDDLHLQVG